MTSKLTTLFTSALALVSLQAFIATSTPNALQPALADGLVKYRPPGRNTPGRTEGSGTRSQDLFSCRGSNSTPFSLKILSPADHMGQTSSSRPTLYFDFTGNQVLEIRLNEIGKYPSVWKKTLKPEKPGIQSIAYPTDSPELVQGKAYRFSVRAVCNEQSYDYSQTSMATLQRVDVLDNLSEQLNKARTASDRAQVYADASLWYEALDTLIKAKSLNPTDASTQTELINLLEQGGLKSTAQREREPLQQDKEKVQDRGSVKNSAGQVYF